MTRTAGRRPALRAAWRWVRPLLGLAVLGLVAWRVGAGAFLTGLRRVDGSILVAAVLLNAVATACTAWRWRTVADAFGARITARDAVSACYRAQFLNATLPTGVLGDVQRAVVHGRSAGDVSVGVRSVVWERGLGQALQLAVAVAVVVAVPSPLRALAPWLILGVVGVGLVGWLVVRLAPRRLDARLRTDARALLSQRRPAVVTAASVLAVACHVTTFVIAAHANGNQLPLAALVAVAALVLVAMAVPLNVAGWGVREGAAAQAFVLVGASAAQGVAVATTYGVLALAATLPGAVVLLRRPRLLGRRSASRPSIAVGSARG
jgi:uncharacterized membrane protein YbhN (UPF0104 family)